MAVDLSGKRLELLKQVVPSLSRVALLTDPKTDPSRERTIKNHQAAAEALGITLWNEDIAAPIRPRRLKNNPPLVPRTTPFI
jgi:putative tryptophan/tyrosine transport system substrate-binding protein